LEKPSKKKDVLVSKKIKKKAGGKWTVLSRWSAFPKMEAEGSASLELGQIHQKERAKGIAKRKKMKVR